MEERRFRALLEPFLRSTPCRMWPMSSRARRGPGHRRSSGRRYGASHRRL